VTEAWNLIDQWTIRDAFELKTDKGKAKAMRSVLKRIANVDREYDVFMNNAIQNAASRKQGDGMIMMGVKCFADQYKPGNAQYEDVEEEDGEAGTMALGANIRILKSFKAMLRSEEIAGHYPIAFAMMARLLGFDLGKFMGGGTNDLSSACKDGYQLLP